MDSKLKKKIILVASLLIILLVVILNLNKIKLALNVYNIYNQEKNMDQADKNDRDIFDPESENPLKPLLEDQDRENLVEEDEGSSAEESQEGEGSTQVDKTQEAADPYRGIISTYNARLEGLQSSFQADLDNLVNSAMTDYKSGSYSKTELASKYLSAGSQLEAASDKQFASLVQEMEGELKVNKLDKKIVDEITVYYSNFKNAEKRAIISHGMSLLD